MGLDASAHLSDYCRGGVLGSRLPEPPREVMLHAERALQAPDLSAVARTLLLELVHLRYDGSERETESSCCNCSCEG